jgi:hypothetical protein
VTWEIRGRDTIARLRERITGAEHTESQATTK